MRSILPRAAALILATLFLNACDKPAAQDAQRSAEHTPEVSVVRAKSDAVPLARELVGRLAATRVAQVRARVAGIILTRVYT
jgi:membrane fusion protein, multidrug efflux system